MLVANERFSRSLLTLRYPCQLFSEMFHIVLNVILTLLESQLVLNVDFLSAVLILTFCILTNEFLLSHSLIFELTAMRNNLASC